MTPALTCFSKASQLSLFCELSLRLFLDGQINETSYVVNPQSRKNSRQKLTSPMTLKQSFKAGSVSILFRSL